MERLKDLSIETLFERAGSTAPAPGGGAVTALCGMLGVSLILKALRISLRHAPDTAALLAAEPVLEGLAQALGQAADADSAAYGAYIAAVRAPRTTDQETTLRRKQLEAAAVAATEVAIDAIEHVDRASAEARAIGALILPRMAADLKAGLHLLAAARANAEDNGRENLEAAGAEEHARLAQRFEAAKLAG